MRLQEYTQGSHSAEMTAVMYVHEEARFEHRVRACCAARQADVHDCSSCGAQLLQLQKLHSWHACTQHPLQARGVHGQCKHRQPA